MKILFVFLAAASVTSGLEYTGLRVKYGESRAQADTEYFFSIPRTTQEAENGGWQQTEPPSGVMEGLNLFCPPDRIVCAMYASSGFVSGVQVAFPVDELETPTIEPEQWFTKWSPTVAEGGPAREYWTATQYLVSEELLKAGGPRAEVGATLQDSGVWVNDLDGRLMHIPRIEAQLNNTLYTQQNCIPNMGRHYYYNMTRETSCNKLLPWFVLTTSGNLVGVGFQIIGRLTKPLTGRNWFEVIDDSALTRAAIPNGPDCLYELTDSVHVISLHIYYIDDPWNLKCRNGDSYKAPAIFDEILNRRDKFISALWDLIKKTFSA